MAYLALRLYLLLILPFALLSSAQNATATPTHYPLLILGGGMTGLSAATLLSTAYNFSSYLLLEATGELGGRMRSTSFGDASSPGGRHVIELGANWVQGLTNEDTGVSNPVWELAQAVNLSTTYSDYSDFLPYSSNGSLSADYVNSVMDSYSDAFDAYLASAGERQARGWHDMTARTGLRLGGWTEDVGTGVDETGAYVQQAVEYWNFDMEYSMSPEESSWVQVANNNNFTFNQFSDENNLVVDPRGFATIATEPFFALPAAQRGEVRLNATVSAIAYSSSGVNVTLSSGEILTADYALCTFSLGVLQSPSPSGIQFTPPLPAWKQTAVSGFAMSTYTKIFLQFTSKFWPDTQFQLYADPSTRGRYTQWQSLDAPGFLPGSKIIFTTVTAQDSVRIESMSDAAVLAELLSVLGGMYGEQVVQAANVTDFYFQRWHEDPLFRGTYSNWPAGYHPAELDNLRAPLPGTAPGMGEGEGGVLGEGRLLFAGEATSFEYFGFLQGAYTEGQRAARAVANCLLYQRGEAGCLGEVWWGEVLEGEGVGETFVRKR
ncbi:amine oxidase [Calocera cornea HHB12733]|uniref:Amine oxidase n=1 Tax=Calocera cornea HHB12733 TaxID=1353952 RepID=A0A165IF89_9BASI|nr:amine oxidase [Calocera cornea HHB12733]